VGALPAMVAVKVIGDPTAPGFGATPSAVVVSFSAAQNVRVLIARSTGVG
jgi:hypothetical protein